MKLEYRLIKGVLQIKPEGDFLGYNDDKGKDALFALAESAPVKSLNFDMSSLGKWDSTLVVVFYELIKIGRRRSLNYNLSELPPDLHELIRLAFSVDRGPAPKVSAEQPFLERWGVWGLETWKSSKKGLHFIGESFHSVVKLFRSSAVMRRVDFLFALGDASFKAVGIVSLVSFMVGLILAFVGAIQLKNFGAQIYVASLVAIGMTWIMGAIMAGIIMAGRTGASYAATIGTMQVNEEIDALKTMGIPVTDFLVLPRISSLVISMPFITLLADFMGIVGGMAVGVFMLGISAEEYWTYTMNALSMKNFLVGIFHGFVYGFVIALCGCYYGIYCGRDADAVGVATTRAVVSSIVWMIVVTGILTAFFEMVGI